MTQFGVRIEPITSPTPGGCAPKYATDAGYDMISTDRQETQYFDMGFIDENTLIVASAQLKIRHFKIIILWH